MPCAVRAEQAGPSVARGVSDIMTYRTVGYAICDPIPPVPRGDADGDATRYAYYGGVGRTTPRQRSMLFGVVHT